MAEVLLYGNLVSRLPSPRLLLQWWEKRTSSVNKMCTCPISSKILGLGLGLDWNGTLLDEMGLD